MRRLLFIAFGLIVGLGMTVTPTWANSWGRHEREVRSVFPQPRDQWKSWGVNRNHGHFHRGTHVISGAPAPTPVWVPAQWWWNGHGWQWVPGHWAY